MIKLLEDFDGSGLLDSHYSRIIRSHLEAYGAGFDFCRFFEMKTNKRHGIICCFNGAVTAALCERSHPNGMMRRELYEFVDFQRPASVELPAALIHKNGFADYTAVPRRFYEVMPGKSSEGLETPEPEEVFKALDLDYSGYSLWLTDTLRRVNRGLEEIYSYKGSVLTLRFKTDRLAYATDLATPENLRNQGFATELLKRVSALMHERGKVMYLASEPELFGFYDKMGFSAVGEDTLYIAK